MRRLGAIDDPSAVAIGRDLAVGAGFRTPVRKVGQLRQLVVGAGVVLGLALMACQRAPSIGADVAVTIDGEEVHYHQFETYLSKNVDREEAVLGAPVLSGLFDRFLDDQLLIRLAIERGFVEPGVEIRAALAYLLSLEGPQVEDRATVLEFYQENADRYRHAEQVKLRQILTEKEEEARAAYADLKGGAEFAEVAKRLSRDPRASAGGLQGILGEKDLPPEFAGLIFNLEPGEISEIVSAHYGFLIFQVVEKYPPQITPLEEVEEEIQAELARQKIDDRVQRFVEEARNRYNVRTYSANFPFDYQGRYREKDDS